MMIKYRISILFFFLFLSCNSKLSAQNIYISPNGDDRAAGTKDEPLRTLQAAFINARHFQNVSVNIYVLPGEYFMSSPLQITSIDSRAPNAQINVIGIKDSKNNFPIFYGGDKISGDDIKVDNNGNWKLNISKLKSNKSFISEMLCVNDKWSKISKFPKNGFSIPLNVKYLNAKDSTQIVVKVTPDVFNILKNTPSTDINSVVTCFYVKWVNIIKRINSFSIKDSTITIKSAALPNQYQITKSTPFTLSNVKTDLNQGQWLYIDNNTILYHPLSGESVKLSKVVYPELENLLTINGNDSKRVNNIFFKNLQFTCGGKLISPFGESPTQAAADINAIVELNYAKNIKFDSIKISNITTNAVWIKEDCNNISIEHSKFEDLGAGAIKIGNYKNVIAKSATSNVIVNDNIIQRGGKIYPYAAGVIIFQSHNNEITQNTISDFCYTAISAGWTWGFGTSFSKNNLIAYNYIHDIGDGILDDLGGIYTLGISTGTKILNNVICNIKCRTYGANGIYNDLGSSDILIENNTVYNCGAAGYHANDGDGNTIRNNIFANNKIWGVRCWEFKKGHTFNFTNNIVVQDNAQITSPEWKLFSKSDSYNNYFQENNSKKVIGSVKNKSNVLSFSKRSSAKNSKREENSQDPGINKLGIGFKITNAELKKQLLFTDIDYSKVGANLKK